MIDRISLDAYSFYNGDASSLVEFQKNSYENFFKSNDEIDGFYRDISMESILKSIFPISDTFGTLSIEYVSHRMTPPKYTEQECIDRGFTYSSLLYVTLRMFHYEVDEDTGISEVASIKEQESLLCEIPLMSSNIGSFILNGVQKVIVSQIHRSPGAFFESNQQLGSLGYKASIIPYKGNWMDFEFDTKGSLYFRINRKKKMHSAYILSSFGVSNDNIIGLFSKSLSIELNSQNIKVALSNFGKTVSVDLFDDAGVLVIPAGTRNKASLQKKYQELYIDSNDIVGSTVSSYINVNGLEIIAGTVLTKSILDVLLQGESTHISILDKTESHDPQIISFVNANIETQQNSMRYILKSMRPGVVIANEDITPSFEKIFQDRSFYDLSVVGRYKINLEFGTDIDTTLLTSNDITNTIDRLLDLKFHNSPVQDLDSLKNRRIRGVGELFGNVFKNALGKLTRSCVEKMNSGTPESLMPADTILASIVSSDIRDFFLLSQLSQFADQTNPLAEIVHKRRISALGPGGLNRDRAGFQVRDVHYSHYGRICPIETPEGANIGLINTLALFARVNNYGFIVTPYRKIINSKICQDIEYLDAIQEYDKKVVDLNPAFIDFEKNEIKDGLVRCRVNGDFQMVDSSNVEYIEVNPKQIISVASALVPFIESNDAARALMGANMQRQAVPLASPEAPIVGTGMEGGVIASTSVSIFAKNDGVIKDVSGDCIVLQTNNANHPYDIYKVHKFNRTNQSTCFNHNINVNVGQEVKKGDILACGPSTDGKELAIGKNLLTAFSTWNGYNYEDAIVISEKVAKSDTFTSVHIEEFDISIRDTRLGAEEVTRDIPNISDEIIAKLDESGVVNIGSYVQSGDILVGKVSPKSDDVLTAEEKLLKAIFGERNSKVKNTSLVVPPGVNGTVVDIKIFTKNGVNKIERAKEVDSLSIACIKKEFDKKREIIDETIENEISDLITQHKVVATHKVKNFNDKISKSNLNKILLKDRFKFTLNGDDAQSQLIKLRDLYNQYTEDNKKNSQSRIENIVNGNDLPNGVLMSIKVYVAVKRKLQPGDKMSGRHGNKGVVSVVLPAEDMPFLEDGTPVDIVLNPLGIANRMNIGQILEVHLGMGARILGQRINTMIDEKEKKEDVIKLLQDAIGNKTNIKSLSEASDDDFVKTIRKWKNGINVATSSFQSTSDDGISKIFETLGLDRSGKFTLYDGLTGEKFERDVTVGVMYMLKLHHLVESKVHARSVGPYSLVTQQPLGGRSYFGGQRLGEMECWALQAYGAAYTLQEMLTVKSDDIQGRSNMYTSIVRGDYTFKHGTPESCNVMLKELRSLGLNIELEHNDTSSEE
ncbi:MAG: DNA-directed RNA polymerase subunit beta [Candidatus Deianiraeaceae bacterium]|jgi:DNA-directed RNA polymerase subunit beta